MEGGGEEGRGEEKGRVPPLLILQLNPA